jgi:hypothetical protein
MFKSYVVFFAEDRTKYSNFLSDVFKETRNIPKKLLEVPIISLAYFLAIINALVWNIYFTFSNKIINYASMMRSQAS